MYTAPNYIQQYLRAIDSVLFAVWNPKKQRWQVREWIVSHPNKRDLKDYTLWLKKSSLCCTISEKDDSYRDIGYRQLDYRAIRAILRSRQFSNDMDVELRKIDEENERAELEVLKTSDGIARDCAKRFFHHYQRPTVYLGGK